jgi:uncharacterized protein YbjT (DUF2867 family)
MSATKIVLVTGATGNQGGAVTRALLAHGYDVVALTRSAESPAALTLAESGARLARGDFDDTNTLTAAMDGVDAVFAMGTPFGTSPQSEVRQGMALIDAAVTSGVGHLVYSSVASADRNTGIPHFDSKFLVERHLTQSAVRWTIVAPVAFMDFVNPIFLDGLRAGELRMAMPADRPLQYVAVSDIGEFVATLVARGDEVFGRRYEIASDERSGTEVAAILARAIGREIRYVPFSPRLLKEHAEDISLMFEWFDRVGYRVDRAELHRDFPEIDWSSLETWAERQDWSRALAPPAAESRAKEIDRLK